MRMRGFAGSECCFFTGGAKGVWLMGLQYGPAVRFGHRRGGARAEAVVCAFVSVGRLIPWASLSRRVAGTC